MYTSVHSVWHKQGYSNNLSCISLQPAEFQLQTSTQINIQRFIQNQNQEAQTGLHPSSTGFYFVALADIDYDGSKTISQMRSEGKEEIITAGAQIWLFLSEPQNPSVIFYLYSVCFLGFVLFWFCSSAHLHCITFVSPTLFPADQLLPALSPGFMTTTWFCKVKRPLK